MVTPDHGIASRPGPPSVRFLVSLFHSKKSRSGDPGYAAIFGSRLGGSGV